MSVLVQKPTFKKVTGKALSANQELLKRQIAFLEIIHLFTEAEYKERLKADSIPALKEALTDLAALLELPFQKIYDYEREQYPKADEESGATSGEADQEDGQQDPQQSVNRDRSDSTSKRPSARSATSPARQRSTKGHDGRGRGGINYSIRDRKDLKLTIKQRIKLNESAVQLIQQPKADFSEAEKETLSLYTGQGGLGSVDIGILNQHYTRYSVTRFMWDTLAHLGLKGGYILEPGCGVGNFAGNRPSDAFKMVMFDYDGIAAKIAQALYPQDLVYQSDVKEFPFSAHKDYLVGAIGNPPFGDYRRHAKDDPFAYLKPRIHDHFILRAIDSVQPGGIVAMITSTGTADKKDDSIRKAMVEQAHFLGAFRLPKTTFSANAHTSVTTDILFFQKRKEYFDRTENDELFISSQPWDEAIPDQYVNSFYKQNPSFIFGEMVKGSASFGRYGVEGNIDEAQLRTYFDKFIKGGLLKAPEQVPTAIEPQQKKAESIAIKAEILSAENVLYQLKELIRLQKEEGSKAEKDQARKALKDGIQTHLKKYSHFSKSKVVTDYYEGKPDYYQLLSLVSANGKTYAAMVEQDTVFNDGYKPKPRSSEPRDTILYFRQTAMETTPLALAKHYKVTETELPALMGKDSEVFYNPQTYRWELRSEYLEGDIYEKMAIAKQQAPQNVAALVSVLPDPKPANEIEFDLRDINSWMPTEIAQAYIKFAIGGQLMGTKRFWTVIADKRYARDNQSEAFGWKNNYSDILELYLNGKDYPKRSVPKDADPVVKAKSETEKMLNNNKMRRLIPKRFNEWLHNIAEPTMLQEAAELWNKNYNGRIEPQFTGDTFSLGNLGKVWTNGQAFEPRTHQKVFVEKALLKGSMVNAHGVGAGKTLSAILLGGALQQTGAAQKPMYVVPSKVIEKWIAEYLAAFPGSRVLNLKMDKRSKEKMLAAAQMNTYDAIFITHEGFAEIPVSAELRQDYTQIRLKELNRQIQEMKKQVSAADVQAAITVANGAKAKLTPPARLLKDLFLMKLKMEQKISDSQKSAYLTTVNFDELGVDALIVDEAHNFKNVFLTAKAAELKIGVATSSQRAEEMNMKIFHINKSMGNKNIFLLTATPTNNTPLEAYIFLSWVAPKLLDDMGIQDPDTFIDTYANIETIESIDSIGRPKTKTIVAGYKKLQSLRKIMYEYIEFVDTGDFKEVVRPDLVEQPLIIQPNDVADGIRRHLEQRTELIKSNAALSYVNREGEERKDGYLYVLMSGSRAAVDPSLYMEKEMRLPTSASPFMYQVEIDNNPAHYLNWRNTQGLYLLQALENGVLTDSFRQQTAEKGWLSNPAKKLIIDELKFATSALATVEGAQIYDKLVRLTEGKGFELRKGTNGKQASQLLNSWGVPGVKFEAAQGNTSGDFNYVLFDQDKISILKKTELRQNKHIVYHGSAYNFDSFNTDFIGKGEGQHIYGWGLYFTDLQEIAKWYAAALQQFDLDDGSIMAGTKADIMIKTLVENHWIKPKDVEDKQGDLHQGVLNGQLIFCDPTTTVSGKDFHQRLREKLIEKGIKENEIAIINGKQNNTPEKKKKIQDAYNKGDIRIIIGNTASMGEGMDLNRYTTHIHHLDVPWKPSEQTQRNGRGHRQGNVNPVVEVIYYLLAKSTDAYRYQVLKIKNRWIKELWASQVDELEETESESGLDYETIMKSLLDDPDAVEALDLSKELKGAKNILDNLEDDVTGYNNAIVQIAKEKNDGNSTSGLDFFKEYKSIDVPQAVSNFETAVKEGFIEFTRTAWGAVDYRWIYNNGNGYKAYLYRMPAYELTSRQRIEFKISTEADYSGKWHGELSRPDANYQGSDATKEGMLRKMWDAFMRYTESYSRRRADALKKVERMEQLQKLYNLKQAEAYVEYYESGLHVFKLIAKYESFKANKPEAVTYFDGETLREIQEFLDQTSITDLEERIKKWKAKANDYKTTLARKNAADTPMYAYLAEVIESTYEGGEKGNLTFDDESAILFTNGRKDTLWIVPKSQVRKVQGSLAKTGPGAAVFAEFNHYEPSDTDYVISLPTGTESNIGTAKRILYRSDKMIYPEDAKGKAHLYEHDYDAGQRPATLLQEGSLWAIRIDNVAIDGRGILN